MTAQQNTRWQTQVREMLREGYGVEDIAVKLACDVRHVRLEVQILRESGELRRLYGCS